MRFPAKATSILFLTIATVNVSASPIPASYFDSLLPVDKRGGVGVEVVTYANMPAGKTLVKQFSSQGFTSTQGFVALDQGRNQIVVAFRGSSDLIDFFTDLMVVQKPLRSQGITDVGDAYVHSGFLDSFNAVAADVLKIVHTQVKAHPDYTLVVTGHSLGGALASIASLALQGRFPDKNLTLYTYGQPRTGNAAFAALVESRLGMNNIFRSVHTFDGVPTLIFQGLGYRHHGLEYWQHKEPASALNVRKCDSGEDSSCSNSIFSTGINLAHPFYYGQAVSIDPTVCMW